MPGGLPTENAAKRETEMLFASCEYAAVMIIRVWSNSGGILVGVILCATADSSGVSRCESVSVVLSERDASATHDPRLLRRASVTQ